MVDGFNKAKAGNFDLIISYFNISNMDGFEMLKTLRRSTRQDYMRGAWPMNKFNPIEVLRIETVELFEKNENGLLDLLNDLSNYDQIDAALQCALHKTLSDKH